jgi:hypothetical protein
MEKIARNENILSLYMIVTQQQEANLKEVAKIWGIAMKGSKKQIALDIAEKLVTESEANELFTKTIYQIKSLSERTFRNFLIDLEINKSTRIKNLRVMTR